jgi:hypothetical protein
MFDREKGNQTGMHDRRKTRGGGASGPPDICPAAGIGPTQGRPATVTCQSLLCARQSMAE